MAETTLQNMSKKGNRIIKPRTRKNANIPRLLVQLRIQVAKDNKDFYPLIPFGCLLKREIMDTDEVLKTWLESEIPEAFIYE